MNSERRSRFPFPGTKTSKLVGHVAIREDLTLTFVLDSGIIEYCRASENFWGCLPQYPPKNLGQILTALAISGIFERFSPGQSGSEVGGPIYINSPTGPPTSEPLWPGENLSKMPEIARAARIWPKFFGGY